MWSSPPEDFCLCFTGNHWSSVLFDCNVNNSIVAVPILTNSEFVEKLVYWISSNSFEFVQDYNYLPIWSSFSKDLSKISISITVSETL